MIRVYKKPALAALLAEAEESHQQFMAFLESLPAEAMVTGKVRTERGRTISVNSMLRAEAADEREHAEQTRTFLPHVQSNP